MPRKITVPNHDHPLIRLNDFKLEVKAQYRKLSTKELDDCVNIQFAKMTQEERDAATHPEHRHQKIDFLLSVAEKQFKAEWEKINGWPFDDAKDPEKLRAHYEARQARATERERAIKMSCPACRSQKAREDMLVCEECWSFVELDERKQLHELSCKRAEAKAKNEPEDEFRQAYYQLAQAIIQRLFDRHVQKRIEQEAADDAAEAAKESQPVPADASQGNPS